MISALAGSFTTLLIGRLVQSIGAGCGFTLALKPSVAVAAE
jgi:predicted MFS family arabinose efflux permease